jgi:hypothetical protein
MKILKFAALFASAAAFASVATPAQAQATRTWVSGVGDDVNPCSRTAPCKTFAGAISKTAAGGEINCLDPGGFGAVTITKSMTIDCHYTEGGALAGGNGIVINDSLTATPNTAVVLLRGLDIFGVNPPTNGIRFVSGAALHVEDTMVRRFNAANSFGISFAPASAARIYLSNVTVANNGSGATGGGIEIKPASGGSARGDFRNVRVQDNANVGLRIDTSLTASATTTNISIIDSEFSGSSTGLTVIQLAGSSQTDVMLEHSQITNNGIGLSASGSGTAQLRASNNLITGNTTPALSSGGGEVRTYGDNLTDGNGSVATFSGVTLQRR